LALSRPADAADSVTPRVELRHDLVLDVAATTTLAGVTLAGAFVRDDLEPSHCRWCDGKAPGEVNAVDDWFRTALKRDDPSPAKVTSDVLAFGAAPVSAFGLGALAAAADGRADGILVDVLAIAEGGLSAVLVSQALESVTLRTRPSVHAIEDDDA